MVTKANGEFQEAVITGLDEVKAELRHVNQRLDRTDARLDLMSERQILLSERQDVIGERQDVIGERQNLMSEQLAATDRKVDRVIAGLSTLLDKVERLS